MAFIEVPFKNIERDDSRNNRIGEPDPAEIKALADSIVSKGLLQPIVCRDLGGNRYRVSAGYRRHMALEKHVKPESIIINAVQCADDAEEQIINGTENMQRKDFSSYEVAVYFKRLKEEYKLTNEEIAKRLNNASDGIKKYSASHVGNLTRMLENLHPTLKEAWEEKHEKATVARLVKLAAQEPAAQMKAWDEMLGYDDKKTEDGEDADPTDKTVKNKPMEIKTRKAGVIKDMIATVKASASDEEWIAATIHALEWCIEKRKKLPGYVAPEVEDDE